MLSECCFLGSDQTVCVLNYNPVTVFIEPQRFKGYCSQIKGVIERHSGLIVVLLTSERHIHIIFVLEIYLISISPESLNNFQMTMKLLPTEDWKNKKKAHHK